MSRARFGEFGFRPAALASAAGPTLWGGDTVNTTFVGSVRAVPTPWDPFLRSSPRVFSPTRRRWTLDEETQDLTTTTLARDRGPRPTKGHTLPNFDRKNPRRSDMIIIIGMTPSSVPSVDATCIIQLGRSDKRLPYRWSRREAEEDESPEKVGQGRGDRRASTTQTMTKVGHQASTTRLGQI
jgi:hypothetical protein